MAEQHNFEHLPLLLRHQDRARLRGGGKPSPQTTVNRNARHAHSTSLRDTAESLSLNWQARTAKRKGENLPVIPKGVPILIQIDPSLELDVLRERYEFEIVAEQEDGFVIVASEDINLAPFIAMVNAFAVQVHGSMTVAAVHKLFDDPDRLGRILSDRLLALWPTLDDANVYIVDVGIACSGMQEIPHELTRRKAETDPEWAKREVEWSQARKATYDKWEEIKLRREGEVIEFAKFYNAEIMQIIDGEPYNAAVLSDSFTIRLKIVGKGLRDFALNYPYIFEIVEPEDISLPQRAAQDGAQPGNMATPIAPEANAPSVCVIDSGIQEAHVLLQPAIDQTASHCFLPGKPTTDIGDFVAPGGHGTRVAGAILYDETVAKDGSPQLPFWIQNARVLNEHNRMPEELFPPLAIRAAVERFHHGPRHTRIFNHSINANGYCRSRYMSAWAAEIDSLSSTYDILIVQSAGNLQISGNAPYLGVQDYLAAGRDYPAYLHEPSARVANPSQSLQALTVGSVAYGAIEAGDWRTFAQAQGQPSSFSRSGFGIWNVIKPEVVEYGGDGIRSNNTPPDIQVGGRIDAACPELVRSTMFPPGPAYDRDAAGTSFAAPKVAHIAAQLQRLLPDEPALLYRALIVQSARWPEWAESLLTELRTIDPKRDPGRRQRLLDEVSQIIRCIGYGIPNEERASSNTDHRTTLISHGDTPIRARECHVYQVPIPSQLRQPADDFDISIEITLSYVAQPRRTRRNLRHYLSTWVDWTTSKLGEGMNDFLVRAMKDHENDADPQPGEGLPWTLHEKANAGFIRNTKRSSGTVQKDWAIVKSNSLPEHFCIAVVGHPGWSHDPDSTARYAIAVTFEILGQEIEIYNPIRTAVLELQTQVEAEVEIGAEAEIDIQE